MDTDDLSEKAYTIIVQAARLCDTLKAELGALSLACEDDVLVNGFGKFCVNQKKYEEAGIHPQVRIGYYLIGEWSCLNVVENWERRLTDDL